MNDYLLRLMIAYQDAVEKNYRHLAEAFKQMILAEWAKATGSSNPSQP